MAHRKSQSSCPRKHAPGTLWPGPAGWQPGRREPETSSAPSSLRAGKAHLSPETNQASVPRPSEGNPGLPGARSPSPTRAAVPIIPPPPPPAQAQWEPGLPAPPRRRRHGGAEEACGGLAPQRALRSRRRGLPATAPALSAPPPPVGPSAALLTRSSDPPPGSSRSP